MIDAALDLSIPTLMRACQGNVKKLPSFMVHDDNVWPRSNVVRTDSRGRIHMRRSAFMRTVHSELPIRPGLWHRIDLQEFHIDLKPHHLQGSTDNSGGNQVSAARNVALVDSAGRAIGDDDYGNTPRRDHRAEDIAADVRAAKEAGTSGSVRSSTLCGGSTEPS